MNIVVSIASKTVFPTAPLLLYCNPTFFNSTLLSSHPFFFPATLLYSYQFSKANSSTATSFSIAIPSLRSPLPYSQLLFCHSISTATPSLQLAITYS